jgi:2-oxoglutarate ferredoxin oxidoreductase subunit delta
LTLNHLSGIDGHPKKYRFFLYNPDVRFHGYKEAAFKGMGLNMKKGYIEIDQELCKGCEICIEFCPKDTISPSDKLNASGYLPAAFTDSDECTGCAICALVCPEVVIEVYRE